MPLTVTNRPLTDRSIIEELNCDHREGVHISGEKSDGMRREIPFPTHSQINNSYVKHHLVSILAERDSE